MRVRRLDQNGDYVFGGGLASFYINQPEAPAQCAWTRIRLWLGQWYLNTSDGTPYQTEVLGKYTGSTADAAIQARLLGTPGVKEILSYSSSLDRDTRAWTANVTMNTIYGPIQLVGPI